MSISCENIKVAFGKKEFLKEVSLTLEQNQITLLYGPSGGGKTSFFNILGGVDAPANPKSSKVCWNGREIVPGGSTNRLRQEMIGFIFSRFYFLRSLTVRENIMLPATLYKGKVDVQKRLDLLCRVFCFDGAQKHLTLKHLLEGDGEHPPPRIEQLSNGQKEMVAIARALILDPPFIFADELLRSYDYETEQAVWKALLHGDLGIGVSKALFMITHKRHFRQVPEIHRIFAIDHKTNTIKEEGREC